MARERIYIFTPDGQAVNDVEAQNAVNYATGLRYSSVYPRGYDACSFRLKRRDIFTGFTVRENYTVIVRDGLRLVWDGFITGMNFVTGGGDEYIDVTAVGWYELFNRLKLAKRWVDNNVLTHLLDYGNNNNGGEFYPHITRRRDKLRINMAPTVSDVDLSEDDYHRELYGQPGINNYIRRIELAYDFRTGEGIDVQIYNVAAGASEGEKLAGSVTFASDTYNLDLTSNTSSLEVRTFPHRTDVYDYNDYIELNTAVIKAHYEAAHRDYTDPEYTISQLIEDCVLIAGRADARIGADFTGLENIPVALDVFTVEKPTNTSAVIDQIAAFGTADYQTICFSVWGRDGTSDGLPRNTLDIWDNSDYEYIVELDDRRLQAFQNSKDIGSIANYIWLSYVQDDGTAKWLTPEDYAGLKDDASIDDYGQIEHVLEIGKANDDEQALGIGYRYLSYHKQARYRGQFAMSGYIQTKNGGTLPGGWVQAGQRVYVPQLGQVFVVRAVNYDAESGGLTITPDLPPDASDFALAELKRAMAKQPPASELVG